MRVRGAFHAASRRASARTTLRPGFASLSPGVASPTLKIMPQPYAVRGVHHEAPAMPDTMNWFPHDDPEHFDDPELNDLMRQARQYLEQYRDSKAAECYRAILEREPYAPSVMCRLALVLAPVKQHWDEANRLVTKAISVQGPLDAALWDAKGYVLRLGGKHEEALQVLERAVKLNPRYALAHWNTGLALNALRRFGPAVLSLERAQQLLPQEVMIDYDKGRALYFLGREEDAFAWLTPQRLADSGPREGFYRGLLAWHDGEVNAALSHFQHAPLGLRANVEDISDIASWKGECLLKLGELDAALQEFEAALKMNAEDTLSLHGKGEVLLHKGDKEAAQKECFDRALAIDPIYYKSDYFRLKEPRYR